MKVIDVKTTVHSDGSVTAQVPNDVPPGEHLALFVVDDAPDGESGQEIEAEVQQQLDIDIIPLAWLPLSAFRLESTSDDSRFRREELYGDDGR